VQSYLEDFARMSPAVYLLTRMNNDFGPNVLDLVARTGLFAAGECELVDHDPDTNQLRVLGHRPFDAVRDSASGHCEVMLRSIVVRPDGNRVVT
jgi:hypothetical protein